MSEPSVIDKKVNELVDLLQNSHPTEEQAREIRRKIGDALDTASFSRQLEAFRELDTTANRMELLDDLELLLSQHQLDSHTSKRYLYRERAGKTLIIIIAILMIGLGMGMIIMPAPPYFEMFTLYYFNPNDGITIMDVISLLIVLTGVYLFLDAVIKKNRI